MIIKKNLLIILLGVVVGIIAASYFLSKSPVVGGFTMPSPTSTYNKELKEELIKRIKKREELNEEITRNHFDEFSQVIN